MPSHNNAPGHFYQVPDNLHLAVRSPYEFAILCHLIQRSNSHGACFPSQSTLAQGIMSTKQVARACRSLADRNLISMTKKWMRSGGIQLEYQVNSDVIRQLVQQTSSPIDCQSNGVQQTDSPAQQTDSPLAQQTDSPSNHTQYVNHTHLTIPSKTTPPTTFEDYQKELRERFTDVDFDVELEKFNLYWREEGRKPPKNLKRALLNWLTKARDFKARDRRSGRELPTSYTAPADLGQDAGEEVRAAQRAAAEARATAMAEAAERERAAKRAASID